MGRLTNHIIILFIYFYKIQYIHIRHIYNSTFNIYLGIPIVNIHLHYLNYGKC